MCCFGDTRRLGAALPAGTNGHLRVEELTEQDGAEAVAVAVDAFLSGEVTLDFVCGPENARGRDADADARRREVAEAMYGWSWHLCICFGRCFGIRGSNGALQAVAMCMPPGAVRNGQVETPARSLRVLRRMGIPPLFQGSPRYGNTMARLDAAQEVLHKLHTTAAAGRHWYVYILAARPEVQGQGHGSALLAAVASMAEVDGVPVYLETAGEANRDYYMRRGFAVRAQEGGGAPPTPRATTAAPPASSAAPPYGDVAGGALVGYGMVLEPAAAAAAAAAARSGGGERA